MRGHECIVCGRYATIALGVRARWSNTNAVWAPNLDAYLCEQHATDGCLVEITLTPRIDGRVTTVTRGPRGEYATALVIGTGVKVTPGQEALL